MGYRWTDEMVEYLAKYNDTKTLDELDDDERSRFNLGRQGMTDRQRKKKCENALRLLAELLAGYEAMHRTEDVELTKFIIEKLRDHMWKEGIR